MFVRNRIIKNRSTYRKVLYYDDDSEVNRHYSKREKSPSTMRASRQNETKELVPVVVKTDTVQDIEETYYDRDKQIKSFIEGLFKDAQDSIFNNHDGDFHSKGLTLQEAMYSNAELSPIPDRLETKTSLKIFGMDSGGRMALENMFDQPYEPKSSLWDYVGINRK